MGKKFLTESDRLNNLEKRGNAIKEAFQREYNKIKRLDESNSEGSGLGKWGKHNLTPEENHAMDKVVKDTGDKHAAKQGVVEAELTDAELEALAAEDEEYENTAHKAWQNNNEKLDEEKELQQITIPDKTEASRTEFNHHTQIKHTDGTEKNVPKKNKSIDESQYESQNPNKDEIIKMVNYTNDILDKKGRIVRRIEDNGLKVQYKIGPLQVFQDGISYEFNAQFIGSDGKNIDNSDSKYRYFDDEHSMKTLDGDIKIFQRSDMWSDNE